MKALKKDKDVWTGQHMGVSFEINHWVSKGFSFQPEEKHNWTHYIYLWVDRIPESHNPLSFWIKGKKHENYSHISYDYYGHSVINSIEFHGGITWYSKEAGFDGAKKIIKIGCDYQHAWDDGQEYDIDYVLSEVQKTIESFRLLVPDYKYWCTGNGKLYDLKDGVLIDETFHSFEYYSDKEWFKEKLTAIQTT